LADVAEVPAWRRFGVTQRSVRAARESARIVIVGAGPVGLTLALDLARRGHALTVLTRLDFISAESRAICFSRRSLDIFDRLGVGQALVDRGVTWNTGKVFRGAATEPVYQFDLQAAQDQRRPAFINLPQYEVEQQLVAALQQLPHVELRWGHALESVVRHAGHAQIGVTADDDSYHIDTEWLLACDGCRSTVRRQLGLAFTGRAFDDHFLIADVRMPGERPAERWFWFDPPFNPGRSALLHRQPNHIWRLDFQLGRDIDRAAWQQPHKVESQVRAMLGADAEFTLLWHSIYTFQCRRMQHFVHDRVLFAGDSAHLVSPFGARGCNGGIADADNLGWKLDRVLRGQAGAALLHSYDDEAGVAADENLRQSTRTTDFLSPASAASRVFRDAVLELAREHAFARPLVNSGRLSTAVSYPHSPLNSADADAWDGGVPPGAPALDAPLGEGWLLGELGERFVLLANGWQGQVPDGTALLDIATLPCDTNLLRRRYALQPGSAYLLRPDQYIAARWRQPHRGAVLAALARALGAPP
jgi:3-(3-hydroxy-phenyl)propionate hydroxylase